MGSRIHYVEQGEGDPILFLHGNPTWSYLWRNIIPYAATVGRAVAMDLIGMGKSDKPEIEYRFFDHVKYVEGFIHKMGLRNLTLVIHDWGSVLGFHYAMRHEQNVKGIAFMEATLRERRWTDIKEPARELFRAIRTPGVGLDLIVKQNIFIERIMPSLVVRKLTDEEMNRYREPFLEPSSRKPMWRWPNEIPFDGIPADIMEVVEAYAEKLKRSEIPKLLFHGNPGIIMNAENVEWCKRNLKNLTVVSVGPGLHHLQEDHPHMIGEELVKWYHNLH